MKGKRVYLGVNTNVSSELKKGENTVLGAKSRGLPDLELAGTSEPQLVALVGRQQVTKHQAATITPALLFFNFLFFSFFA
jgi:hypothetical protein